MEGGLKRFFEGSWQEAQSLLGAHRTAEGWCFRVYAPNARSVRVAGDFSDWQGLAMNRWPEGIWETTVPQAQAGQSYKYVVEGADGRTRWKAGSASEKKFQSSSPPGVRETPRLVR